MDKNTKKRAVALKYDQNRAGAPVVVASGHGAVAENILAKAREAGVEIVADPDLSELLARIPLGREIPPELYQAVAEILAFVYRVNKSRLKAGKTD
jgi:flagellar biosynthesis protein